jgi:hypothetical protein
VNLVLKGNLPLACDAEASIKANMKFSTIIAFSAAASAAAVGQYRYTQM